jgi:hypothetical protein
MKMYTEEEVKTIAKAYAESYSIMDSVQIEYKYDKWYKHYNATKSNPVSKAKFPIENLNQETHAQFNQEMVTKLTDNIVTRFSNRIKELLK